MVHCGDDTNVLRRLCRVAAAAAAAAATTQWVGTYASVQLALRVTRLYQKDAQVSSTCLAVSI
jgi:hypothetical protein